MKFKFCCNRSDNR